MSKFKPCPLCSGRVMYYGRDARDFRAFGEHFVCTKCDHLFASVTKEMWKSGNIGDLYVGYNSIKLENAFFRARLKSAEDERDKMKVCGNCGRNSNSLIGDNDGDCHEDDDQCLENVGYPNWTPRKAKS